MSSRLWCPVVLTLAGLLPALAEAQLLTDPSSLRQTLEAQVDWAESLSSIRQETAADLLAVAQEVLELPASEGGERVRLLSEAQRLAGRLASLDGDLVEASSMVRDTRSYLISALGARIASLRQAAAAADPQESGELEGQARTLEEEVNLLRSGWETPQATDPLESASGTLLAMAELAAVERARLETVQLLQEELRLFLGDLRLFDETAMPPSAGGGGGSGEQDPGCQPSACAFGEGSPADVPLTHARPDDLGETAGAVSLTPASLARLQQLARAYAEDREGPPAAGFEEEPVAAVETVLGTSLVAFRGDGDGASAVGPRLGTSLVRSWSLDDGLALILEPAVGGRAHRSGSSLFGELAGEARENLTGFFAGGPGRWQVASWQKVRYLSEPLSPPGYLEPGRLEAGILGRLSVPLASGWLLEGDGGADVVRYEPEDWKGLDRQGLSGSVGLRWRGATRSVGLAVRGSRYGFPRSPAEWEEERRDARLGLELNGSLEGAFVAHLSLGGSWNQSRIPAYDFWLGRTALLLSAPWGRGSLQGYVALAHQVYLNPGPKDARVAPSDQDSGSVLAFQYALPVDPTHLLAIRVGWSRSQTGFRNDFYERFGVSVHLAFRRR